MEIKSLLKSDEFAEAIAELLIEEMKGDKPGHAFRGNQYREGIPAGEIDDAGFFAQNPPNPDAPRELFHGTSVALVDKILKEGIRSDVQHVWGGFHLIGERARSVYMMDNPYQAAGWGVEAYLKGREWMDESHKDVRCVVFEVEVPQGHPIKQDELVDPLGTTDKPHAFRVVGNIPPDWIKGYSIYKPNKSEMVLLESHRLKQLGNIFYVPVVYIDSSARKKSIATKAKRMTPQQKQNWERRWKKIIVAAEKRYTKQLKGAFTGMRDEVLANMKKHPKQKGIVTKENFNFEDWEFTIPEWQEEFATMQGDFIKDLYDEIGDEVFDYLIYTGVDENMLGSFNSDTTRVKEFIEDYSFKFAEDAVDTTVEGLRAALTEGIDAGLDMDEMAEKVQEAFDYDIGYRAELIARTETIRASNAAAEESYRQSEGVVKAKEWLCTADDRLCDLCAQMDGTVIELGGTYLSEGDDYTAGTRTLTNDYEDIDYPPLHPNCRCCLIPVIDEEYLKAVGFNIIAKGEAAGHPFRGNQYTEGEHGVSASESFAQHKETAHKLFDGLGAKIYRTAFGFGVDIKEDAHAQAKIHERALGLGFEIISTKYADYDDRITAMLEDDKGNRIFTNHYIGKEYTRATYKPANWNAYVGVKGEGVGHPFRGNQYREGEHGGSTEDVTLLNSIKAGNWKHLRASGIGEDDFKQLGAAAKYPDCTVSVSQNYSGDLLIEASWRNDRGSPVGSFESMYDMESKSIHINYCSFVASEQGKGNGHAVLAAAEELGRKLGMTKIELLANITIGVYAWAREGFDFANEGDLEYHKSELFNFIKQAAEREDIKISTLSLTKEISKLESAEDIAKFKLRDFDFTKEGWQVFGASIPRDLRLHAGKAYMLRAGAWDGVKEISPSPKRRKGFDAIAKGEAEGHPFRGNQYREGILGRVAEIAENRSMLEAKKDRKGNWVQSDGSKLPKHIRTELQQPVPPGWTAMFFQPDRRACLRGCYSVTGVDEAGRQQSLYHKKLRGENKEANFARVAELDGKISRLEQSNEKNFKSRDEEKRENASVLRLIMETAVRPGSDKDTKAEKQAYGATTLLGKHIVQGKDGRVSMQFTGKSGQDLTLYVNNKVVAKDLLDRAKKAGKDGRIFDTSYKSLWKYTKNLTPKGFTPKDFRTLTGTRIAVAEIAKLKAPTTEKEYKKAIKEVATVVSQKLGNTPTVALQNYINPSVFGAWRQPGWGEKKKKKFVYKGESAGHPFRGNQYREGQSGAGTKESFGGKYAKHGVCGEYKNRPILVGTFAMSIEKSLEETNRLSRIMPEVGQAWKRAILEKDPKATLDIRMGQFPKTVQEGKESPTRESNAFVEIHGKSKEANIMLGITLYPNADGNVVKMGDSGLPKHLERQSIFSRGLSVLNKDKFDLSGKMAVHHSTNNAAWRTIATKLGWNWKDWQKGPYVTVPDKDLHLFERSTKRKMLGLQAILKGEAAGHPFRGNQYREGVDYKWE